MSGTYRPTDNDPESAVDSFPAPAPVPGAATELTTFNDTNANGVWSLWVADDALGTAGSLSGGWCLTITSQSPTTTAVTTTPNPSTFGQTVTLRAVVTSGANPVTAGTVQFRDGATNLAPPVPVDGDGVATLTASALAVGSHTITAAYSGTAVLAESSGTVTQVVNRADSTTVLTSSLNPSDFGDLVTFTATVTAGGSPLTTGSVQFAVDGTDTGGPLAIDGSGQATFTTGGLAAGTHEITATHGGSTNYGPSGDDLDQVVNKLLTTTDLATSGSPSSFGQLVTFTANVTVTGDGDAATGGSVQFRDGTTDLGAPVAVIAGTATYDTATLTVGTHTITAAYLGTAALGTSSDSLDQVVGQALSTTVVSSSGTPSIFGDPVTFTAIVASGGQPVVGGTVQFLDGTTNLGGPVTVVAGGTATYQAEDLSVGTHPITATFSGTTEIAGSTSGTFDQVVEKAPTVVVLTTAPDPSTFGQLVTLTAEVTVGGVPLTEGTVAFSEGGTVFCEESALQSGGTATCPTDDLTVGAHTITATYSGTDDYAMNDDTDGHDVNQAATTVTLASSSNPAAYGLPVTFTATVSAGADPVGEGSVTIFVDGMPQQIDRDVDSAGQVTYTTSTLLAGSHTIRAEYSGSISYLASVSVDLQQQVEILADAGGPYEIAEGDSVTLDAAGSSPTGDYQWDLNDDGVFGDATGVDPTLTWAELESFGMDDGRSTPTSYPIAVQISSGAVRLVAASAIIVTNTAPAAIITGDLTATVGEPFTIKVGADDPSSADLTEQFTYTVDWGDGTPVFTVDGPADPPVTHTYSSAGEYAAQFTATDKDGGTGPGTTVTVLVAAAPTASPTPSPNPTTDDSYDSYDDDDTDSGSLASTGAVVGLGTILVGILLLGAGGAVLIASRRRTGRRAG
ncbi:MAG TPA: Ig-like domain repeat protein [Microlunatus sp.]